MVLDTIKTAHAVDLAHDEVRAINKHRLNYMVKERRVRRIEHILPPSETTERRRSDSDA